MAKKSKKVKVDTKRRNKVVKVLKALGLIGAVALGGLGIKDVVKKQEAKKEKKVVAVWG